MIKNFINCRSIMPLQLVSREWMELVHIFAKENQEMSQWAFKYIPTELKPKSKDFLKHLCFTIIYQAISAKVCQQMWIRFKKLMKDLGYNKEWPPEIVASLTNNQLLNIVKLSNRKVEAVRNVAFYLIENPINTGKSSENLIKEITTVKGVGPFTAKYFLFDCLGRLDISLYDDLLVRKGLKIIHKLSKVPTIPECKKLTEKWGPLASIGSLICYSVYHYER